jgi:hypothetical protein
MPRYKVRYILLATSEDEAEKHVVGDKYLFTKKSKKIGPRTQAGHQGFQADY